MKLKSIGMCAVALLLAASCSRKEDKVAECEVNENGLPLVVADILIGDSCKIDTLYAGEDNVYMLVNNSDYRQKLIFDTHGLIVNNPVMTIDSLTPTSYRIGDLINSTVVDFSIDENVETLRKLFPVYDDFSTVTYSKMQTQPNNTLFSMSVSRPDQNIENADDITRWVASEMVSEMDSVPFDGSFEVLGGFLAGKMNERVKSTVVPFTLFETYSALVYRKTDEYVTYFNMYSSFLGGAHGMYGYSFPTYLIQANRPLTFDYMFLPESINEIRELIYESFLAQTDFTSNHNINSVSQVKSYINDNIQDKALPVPDPGLLADGVVFCYQPYEVGSFADGAFQIVIPYGKLKEFMTDAGKRLIQ